MLRHLVVAVALCTMLAQASESYIDKTPTWSGPLNGKAGGGHCTIECDHPSRGTNVRLHAGGLVPSGAYLALYTDYDGKEKPLGTGGGEAKADSKGWLDYAARLPSCPLGDKIKVTLRYSNPPNPPQDILVGTLIQQ